MIEKRFQVEKRTNMKERIVHVRVTSTSVKRYKGREESRVRVSVLIDYHCTHIIGVRNRTVSMLTRITTEQRSLIN